MQEVWLLKTLYKRIVEGKIIFYCYGYYSLMQLETIVFLHFSAVF
jgi:hypothetical protein